MTAEAVPPTMTMAGLRPGMRGAVAALDASLAPQTARRLRDLGFRPGTVVEMIRKAPLGDPCVYRVRNYDLCLRRGEAAMIQMCPCEERPTDPAAE